MAFKIYKYELTQTETHIPKGSVILDIQVQKQQIPGFKDTRFERVCLWAIVNTEVVDESDVILTYGTGEEIPNGLVHKKTVQLSDGTLVFHVFTKKTI